MADQQLMVGRRCPVYALAPGRMFGLSTSAALGGMVVFAALNPFMHGWYSSLNFPISGVAAWIIEKMTSGREAGFAVQWTSAHATGSVAQFFAQSWRGVGAMAPPNAQKRYEP